MHEHARFVAQRIGGGELGHRLSIKTGDELEDERARCGEQHRTFEGRGVIAPEQAQRNFLTPVGEPHLHRGRAFDIDRRRAQRTDEVAQATRELVADAVEHREGIAVLRLAQQKRRLRVGRQLRRGVDGFRFEAHWITRLVK